MSRAIIRISRPYRGKFPEIEREKNCKEKILSYTRHIEKNVKWLFEKSPEPLFLTMNNSRFPFKNTWKCALSHATDFSWLSSVLLFILISSRHEPLSLLPSHSPFYWNTLTKSFGNSGFTSYNEEEFLPPFVQIVQRLA